MKYLMEDKISYFSAYKGQNVLNLGAGGELHTVTDEVLANLSDSAFLSLRPVASMSDKEAIQFYKHFSPGTATKPDNCRVWANTIAKDLSAPNFNDGYVHLISEGFLVPYENKSAKLLIRLGWAKER